MILLDASGSMEKKDWKPNRLAGAIASADAYVNQLAIDDPDACVAVILYSTIANMVISLTPARHFEKINLHLGRIRSGFTTNITAALEEACRICSKTQGTNQVVLLTDGFHNFGLSPKKAADKLRKYATIECVGIGGKETDVDSTLLKYIASSRPDGTKRYRWIGEKETLVRHFRNLATGLSRS
jgi:Mg-chelatase subunit ChlD